MPLNTGWEKVANMTRETKLGLVVSCSFLCLLGVVLALKLTDTPAETGVTQLSNEPTGEGTGTGPQKQEATDNSVAQASTPPHPGTADSEKNKPGPSGKTGSEGIPSGSGDSITGGNSSGGSALAGEPGKLDEALVRADWTTQTDETGERWWHPPMPPNNSSKTEPAPVVAAPPGKKPEFLGTPSSTSGPTGDGLPPVSPPPISGPDKEATGSLALGGSPPSPDKTTGRPKEDKTPSPATLNNSTGGSPKETPPLEPIGKPGVNPGSEPSDPKLTRLAPEKKEGDKDTKGALANLPLLPGKERENPVPLPGPKPGEAVSPSSVPDPLMPPVKPTTTGISPLLPPDEMTKPGGPAASTGTGSKPSETTPAPLGGEDKIPKESAPIASLGLPKKGITTPEEPARSGTGSPNDPLPVSPRLTPPPVDTSLESGSRSPIPAPSPSPAAVPALNLPSSAGLGNSVQLLEPKVISFSEEIYSCSQGDNFSTISKQKYGTDKLAQALMLFNRNHPLAGDELSGDAIVLKPQQKIYLPPADILENRYPASIKDPSPVPGTDNRIPSTSPPGVPGETRTERTPATGGASPGTSSATRPYRVQGNGETMRQIAGRLLGTPDRWNEIYELNPGWRPEFLVPGGTVVTVPAASTADSR